MRLLTLSMLACCLLIGCASGALPTQETPIKTAPPPNLTAPPQPLPQPESGQMRDLEANHLQVAKAYHLLASQMCQLLTYLQTTLWLLVTERQWFIPIVMDSFDQAATMLEAVKVELESNPRLAMDFPNACGRGRVWNAGVIVSASGRKVQAFGSGKKMRGLRHGPHRPGFVLLDDIENDENVRSKEQRDKTEAWVKKVVMPLGPPDGSMHILYLNTILHYDSVADAADQAIEDRMIAPIYQMLVQYENQGKTLAEFQADLSKLVGEMDDEALREVLDRALTYSMLRGAATQAN